MYKPVAAFAALLLGGCAFPHTIGNIAMDYNDAVARTSNELTLLNILRARERQPLHFTAISALRGSISFSASASINGSLKGHSRGESFDPAGNSKGIDIDRGVDVFTPSGSLNVSSAPSFDVGVLNSQEFQRGVLTPVTPKLLDFFLEQGWPRDFITALFVERIEYRAAQDYPGIARGDVIEMIDNRPDRPASASLFAQFLGCFALRPVTVRDPESPILELSELQEKSSLGDLAAFDNGNLNIRSVTGNDGKPRRMIVRSGKSQPGLALAPMGAASNSCDLHTPAMAATDGAAAADARTLTLTGFRPQTDETSASARIDADADAIGKILIRNGDGTLEIEGKSYKVSTQMVLRSPFGVIYFLGEYARAADPYRLRGQLLIDIRPGTAPDAFVRSQLGGEHYYIAARDGNRSLQTLSIVEQIVNLQKSASELPSTGAVQIVN